MRRKIQVALSLATLFVFSCFGWYGWRAATQEPFLVAWQYLQRGSTTEAISQLRILQRLRPDSSETRLLRAAIDVRMGMPELALRHLSYLPGDQHREKSLLVAGECYYRLHRYLEAEVAFRQLTALNPESDLGLRWLVAVYYDLGAYDQATDIATRLISLRSQDFSPHRMLGMMSRDFERNKQAISHFRQALKLNPPKDVRFEIVEELAAALVDEHEYSETISLIEGSLVRSPIMSHSLAQAYWALGDQELAVKHLNDAEEGGTRNNAVALTRSRFALESGDLEKAEPILREIVASDPANIDAYYIFGQALVKLGKHEEARVANEKRSQLLALKESLTELNIKAIQNPRDAQIRYELADTCDKLGKQDLAQMWRRAANACLSSEAVQNHVSPGPNHD